MLSSELCLKYTKVRNKLKDFYQKASDNHDKYTENFPHGKSKDERLEYNKRYMSSLKDLDDEYEIICSEVKTVEDEVVKAAPDFIVHKY